MRIHLHVVARPSPSGDVGWLDEILERVDGYAIDRLSTGDVIGNHLECFAALGYMAARTERVHVGPFITSAAMRDVGVLAAFGASLDAMSRGRAFLVLGRGDGAARNLGIKAQTVGETREAVAAVRALLHEGRATYRGRAITVSWPEPPGARIPVYTAPGGPRMLEMSAAVCDGVYLATGCTPAEVRSALDTIAAARRDAPLDTWWVTRFGVAADREAAIAVASEGLSSMGNHSLRGDYAAKGVPAALVPSLTEYHARYRYDRKNPVGGTSEPANVELMNELGLRDYFLDRFGIVGTPDEVVERLLELERRGVHSVVLLADSAQELDLIGTRVLPRMTARA